MNTIWSFDLGKASIGEAVRVENAARFLHKTVLLIPPEHAIRGPSSKSGTPASRYRMWRTREGHWQRELWLDELWQAAGLTPLARRTVEPIVKQWTAHRKTVRGKEKVKTRAANVEWQLAHSADRRLESEFAGPDEPLHTSCLLRIALLQGQSLSEPWQIYKALFSALQKRGYSDVPWKEQRKGKEAEASEEEKAENARAGLRWQEFLDALNANKLGERYQRACYYDAWRMKLWNPAQPRTWKTQPDERPESTQKVAFPGRIIEEELIELAQAALRSEMLDGHKRLADKLKNGADEWMKEYRARTHARIQKANAYRREKGRKELAVPDFSTAAGGFAELLVYGPGGGPDKPGDRRAIASFDPARRRAVALRPGTPADWQAALGQRVARFDNRLRRDCALIPRLNCCRNTSDEDLKKAKDGAPCLLPVQVTFLMKLKNMRVQERNKERTQRGLKPKEIADIFTAFDTERKYSFTKGEWRKWCTEHDLLPVLDSQDKAKAGAKKAEQPAEKKATKTDYAVERASTEGRSRFSRPALRLLKELTLSGDAPSAFRARLLAREPGLLQKLGSKERPLEIFADTGDKATDDANRIKGLLESDLSFLGRMRKQSDAPDTWDDLHIPTSGLDFLALEGAADAEHRQRAIRQLIGLQNNPIVRHRLETFWQRLKTLAALKGEDGQPIGPPAKIIIELVRDDPESSWLGKDAKSQMDKAMKEQRERREQAKARMAEMGDPHGDLTKFLLWEAQGCQCLYGKEVNGAQGAYLETAIGFTEIPKCRVDHIVPRAKGGPDAFYNLILTTNETNEIKGDRTPWRWFHEDRDTDQWDAYRERVLRRQNELGLRKVRLLLSADAEKLVERYKPLAETAWIARLAQTIASLHFGWANGVDAEGKRRAFIISGGLTGRIRRRYHVDSLLGNDRALDEAVSALLDEQATLRAELAALPMAMPERDPRYPRLKQIKARLRELRDELGEKAREAEKQRGDKRHHGLDAMVLNCLEGWMNDPRLEERIRLTDLGDNPWMPSANQQRMKAMEEQIDIRVREAREVNSPEQRQRLHKEITGLHDEIARLHQPPDVIAVREALRKEITGDEAVKIAPIFPRQLYFEKPKLEATFHRGVWLRMESEGKAERATIHNFDRAYVEDRVALERLPYLDDGTPEGRFCSEHGKRRIAGIVEHKDYDASAIRRAVEQMLAREISAAKWTEWCRSDAAPRGLKPKKNQPDAKEIYVYRLEEKRTKRVRFFDLGVGTREVDEYDRGYSELQVSRLVLRPERGKDSPDVPLVADIVLQEKLNSLRPRIEEFFAQYPPDAGDLPRKPSERIIWQQKRDEAKAAWDQFVKDTGLDRHKVGYVRTDGPSVTERRYEKAGLRSLLLTKVRRFDPEQARKQAQSIVDSWMRFQLRQFLARNPLPSDWKAFCDTLVQIPRAAFADFLATEPTTAAQFINFYRRQAEGSSRRDDGAGAKMRSLIRYVQQVIGNADTYVDVSKDGSGIYAKGGNKGYFVWKKISGNGEAAEFGAMPVLGFESYASAKQRLLAQKDVELLDGRLWKTNMLLHLPQDTPSGKKLVPQGFYYFGSISNGAYATLKPLVGGDNFDGIGIASLLKSGLQRHVFSDEVEN